MRRLRVSACVFAAAASLAACTGSGDVEYAGEVRVTSPELVEIRPGVQVIADADEPLFYADGYYWLYRDGYWLRSDSYRGGFAAVEISYVPERVRAIDQPQLYVQYRRHMGRERQARGTYTARRSQQPPGPPPHQGVPSTPPPETWQPGQQPTPSPTPPATTNPLDPRPTPPLTSPSDVEGTPMSPHRGGIAAPPPPASGDRHPPEHDGANPPDDRGPEAPAQESRPQARPEDRNAPPPAARDERRDRTIDERTERRDDKKNEKQ